MVLDMHDAITAIPTQCIINLASLTESLCTIDRRQVTDETLVD
jgi:hypothetical protein